MSRRTDPNKPVDMEDALDDAFAELQQPQELCTMCDGQGYICVMCDHPESDCMCDESDEECEGPDINMCDECMGDGKVDI